MAAPQFKSRKLLRIGSVISVDPLVSIVLPVHNGERFLANAMTSVLQQTYSNFELIVVDDASTDQSRQVVESFCILDERVRLVVNGSNLKLPRSLNRGFMSSSGQYVTWTSDDNLLTNSFLEKMVRALESSSADFVFCDYSEIDAEGKFIRLVKTSGPATLIRKNEIGAGFLYKRELLDVVGEFDVDCFLYEDYEYWTRIARSGFKMQHVNENLYQYRVHSGQLSSTHRLPSSILSFRKQLLADFPSTKTEIAKASARLALDLAKSADWLGSAQAFQVGLNRIFARPLA